jgi:hypothetical protein
MEYPVSVFQYSLNVKRFYATPKKHELIKIRYAHVNLVPRIRTGSSSTSTSSDTLRLIQKN